MRGRGGGGQVERAMCDTTDMQFVAAALHSNDQRRYADKVWLGNLHTLSPDTSLLNQQAVKAHELLVLPVASLAFLLFSMTLVANAWWFQTNAILVQPGI